MALVPYEGQDDDADANIIECYRNNNTVSTQDAEEAIKRQQAMIYWAREHVVDDVVLYRGFQVLEAATHYTDESLRNFAFQVLREAQSSTSELVHNTALEVIGSFDEFRQQVFRDLTSFSAYVEASTDEVRQEVKRLNRDVRSETQRLQAHVSAEAARVKMEAESTALSLSSAAETRAVETLARNTTASAKHIEVIKNNLLSEIENVRKAVEEAESRRVVTAENVEDAIRRLKRAEEASAAASQRLKGPASTSAVSDLESKVRQLQNLIRPLSEFVEENKDLVQETQRQREEMRMMVAEIQALNRRSEEISEKMKAASQTNATKEELQAAINNIAAGHRQQRTSQAQAGDNANHMLQHALRREINTLAGTVEQATLVIGLLHFPTEDLEARTLSERIALLKTLAERKARQPNKFEPIVPLKNVSRQPAASPAPTRPQTHAVIDLTHDDVDEGKRFQPPPRQQQVVNEENSRKPAPSRTRPNDDDFELVLKAPLVTSQRRLTFDDTTIAFNSPQKAPSPQNSARREEPFDEPIPVSQVKTLQRAHAAEQELRQQNGARQDEQSEADFVLSPPPSTPPRKMTIDFLLDGV